MTRPEDLLNFKAPDYAPIFAARTARLHAIRSDPAMLASVRLFYAANPVDFISDWGVTIDPRVASTGRPAIMPFVLFPKQRDWIAWLLARWHANEPGLTDKSRDVGMSWLAMAISCTLCLFHDDISIGFGSAKEDKVDRLGDPDSLFYKGRMFMSHLPREFRGGWDVKRHAPHMRLVIPETNSTITGEAGDNIGRGGRKAIYFIDEAAHIERPALIDASLSANTDCRIDMSSVKGLANPFAEKRHGGKISVFTFHYSDDPRKDAAWAAKKRSEVDPITWAQEYELSYNASVEGVVIPAVWVSAAVNAHIKLGITPSGIRTGALDVADRGIDKNAMAFRHGILLAHAESWSGAATDLYGTAEKAFLLADMHGVKSFSYDGDGLGASVRGDSRKINEGREHKLTVTAFRGSGEVFDPDRLVPQTERTAKDFFENFKAQAWWALRFRFQATWRALQGHPYDPSDVISIAADFPERLRLCMELSQPVYLQSKSGKLLIDKQPDGVASPNLADSVMMAFAPRRLAMVIDDKILEV